MYAAGAWSCLRRSLAAAFVLRACSKVFLASTASRARPTRRRDWKRWRILPGGPASHDRRSQGRQARRLMKTKSRKQAMEAHRSTVRPGCGWHSPSASSSVPPYACTTTHRNDSNLPPYRKRNTGRRRRRRRRRNLKETKEKLHHTLRTLLSFPTQF